MTPQCFRFREEDTAALDGFESFGSQALKGHGNILVNRSTVTMQTHAFAGSGGRVTESRFGKRLL